MQSINLYLPEYRPKREWLSLRGSLIGFALFLVAMIAMHLNQSQNLRHLTEQVVLLQQQESTIKQQADELKNRASSSNKQLLKQQIDSLRAAIANRNAIKQVMSGNSLGNQEGFSQHMYVLGEKRVDDLVINRFAFTRGGEYVELEGHTRKPSSVPLYVHELQQTPVFSRAKFGFLTINDEGGLARFRLSGGGAMSGETLRLYGNKELKR